MGKKVIFSQFYLYSIALVSSVAALFIALLFQGKVGIVLMPALFFLPAILLSAWYGGIGPGLLATGLTEGELGYFSLSSHQMTSSFTLVMIVQIGLYLVEGIVLCFLIGDRRKEEKFIIYRKRELIYQQIVSLLQIVYLQTLSEIRSRDEFLSIASHELKTPLTSMLLQIQTALHNIRHVSLAEFSVEHLLQMLQSTENQTKRLSRMINDLLNISLLATDRMELEREEFSLNDLTKTILQDFAPRFEREGYTVVFEGDERAVGFWDKLRVEQALTNLISNAIKYGNKKPIEVIVRTHDNHVAFVVTDHGIGIDKKKHQDIFVLFQRAVQGDEYKGLGIGLYITNKIVILHGGKIDMQSKLGHGSSFRIRLPLERKTSVNSN